MYTNDILLAIKFPYAKKFKKVIPNCFDYIMEQKNGINYYHFDDVLWHDGLDPFSEAIIEYLSEVPDNDFAFIRIGNSDDIDVEIHGTPSALNIRTHFEVDY